MSTSWPQLESATGRARKRRLRIQRSDVRKSAKQNDRTLDRSEEEIVLPPYPPGQPWRILWPSTIDDHEDDSKQNPSSDRRLPTWKQIKNGWKMYMETWEDGLRGEPSAEKLRLRAESQATKERGLSNKIEDGASGSSVEQIQDNVSRNLRDMREDAEGIIEQAKGSKEDIQKIAADAMRLATECLQEFMTGYRHGRDQEIDKMLNEYFQETSTEESTKASNGEKKTRRRRKRVTLR